MLEVLKYILPGLLVLIAACVILHQMLKEERDRRDFELKKNTRKEVTTVRLRGYERLALLLERTTPEHILRDIDLNGLTVRQLQILMLKTIRMEFDHNLSQQIYVSDDTWESILIVQEELGRFVSTVAQSFPAESPALPYAQQMITVYNTNGETPTDVALGKLRNEARALLI